MKTYTGYIESFSETGTEGHHWVLIKENLSGYDALEHIKHGDYLTIYEHDNTILFEGTIDPNYHTGWTEYYFNPGYGQPSALGYWIHWTQKDWHQDDWAKLFFCRPPLKAKLIRK